MIYLVVDILSCSSRIHDLSKLKSLYPVQHFLVITRCFFFNITFFYLI